MYESTIELNDFQKEIWLNNYKAPSDNTIEDTFRRVANTIAAVEEDQQTRKLLQQNYYKLMSQWKFLPGGRITANAGTGREKATLYNCFPYETKIITDEGVQFAGNLKGRQVNCLSSGGEYRKTVWKSFGKQKIYKLMLENGDELHATKEHEWVVNHNSRVRDGFKRVYTIDMKNKRIPLQGVKNFCYDDEKWMQGVRHGITFGDGWLYMEGKYASVSQYGNNVHLIYDYFQKYNITQVKSDMSVRATKLPAHYKSLPLLTENKSYLRGFIAGLIASDGNVDCYGNVSLFQSSKYVLQYVRDICNVLGIPTLSLKMMKRNSNHLIKGKEVKCCKDLWKLKFSKEYMCDKHLIIKEKHKSYLFNTKIKHKYASIKVVDVVQTDRFQQVFCCEEPQTHTITIENCYLTGQCYVYNPQDFGITDIDSMQVIFDTLKKSAKILASQGGLGINVSYIRPNGSYIVGTGVRTPGVVKFLQMWDKASQIITMGSTKDLNDGKLPKKKIRKGAMMASLSVHHGDIKQFIIAKQQSNRLSRFNLSVLVSDKFMNAVQNDQMWQIGFPDTSWQSYSKLWDGNIDGWVAKKYPFVVSETLPARELWNLIMMSTYTRNEPGVLFFDTLNDYNPVKYIQTIMTTNPCLTGDTLIAVADGRNAVTIRQLAQQGREFPVYSMGQKVQIVSGKAFKTKQNATVVRVILDDNSEFLCTPDHKIMLRNGQYKEAKHLKEKDSLMPFNSYISNKQYRQISSNVSGDRQQYRLMIAQCNNHKVKRVQFLQQKYDVYDITVNSNNHNFGIITSHKDEKFIESSGVFVHNCGEIGMSSGVCNLGSLNLPRFFKDGGFDYDSFEQAIKYGVCFLDGVCDVSYIPLPQYYQKVQDFRRIGLGVTGLGSLLSMLGLKFGSYEAIKFVDQLFKFKCQIQLITSAFLGKSKGSFLKFNRQQYFSSKWWYQLPISYQIKRQIERIGCMRNAVHGTVPPSGNCQIPSSAIITEQGIKTLKEIFQQNLITSKHEEMKWYIPIKPLNVLTLQGFKRITGLYKNKTGKTLKIKTKSGNIQGTEEHKVLVKLTEDTATWKKLGQLKAGEKILFYKE